MRTPLIRQGAGPTELKRIYDHLDDQHQELLHMIGTATADTEQTRRKHGIVAGRSAAGDEHRLRAIPVTARGVAGVIPGTQPEHATIRRLTRLAQLHASHR